MFRPGKFVGSSAWVPIKNPPKIGGSKNGKIAISSDGLWQRIREIHGVGVVSFHALQLVATREHAV